MTDAQREQLRIILLNPATAEVCEALRQDLKTKALAQSFSNVKPADMPAFREENLRSLWVFDRLIKKMAATANQPQTETEE